MGVFFLIALLVGVRIAYYAWKEYSFPGSVQPKSAHKVTELGRSDRKCLACGYEGKMKTWIANYNVPQLIAAIGLMLLIIPGLIFIVLY